RDPEDELIVTAVTDLAHSMGVQIIAEGIETTSQMQMLAAMGCEFGQGFLWSPALDFDDAWTLHDATEPLEHVRIDDDAQLCEGDGLWGRDANAVSDSVALLVHELAAPLTVAGGYASLLQESGGPD